MSDRKLCPDCRVNYVAVNYSKDGVTHYRSRCSSCIRKGKKLKPDPPAWARSGYKKKTNCEKCNFKFKLLEQSVVFHVDGNLKNNNWANLKTICLNCQQEIIKSKAGWKSSPIVPDF